MSFKILITEFFKFLVKEGLFDQNPCEDIKNFKRTKKIPGYLSEVEIFKILNCASTVGKNKVEKAFREISKTIS